MKNRKEHPSSDNVRHRTCDIFSRKETVGDETITGDALTFYGAFVSD